MDPVEAVFARISSIVTDDLVTRTSAVYSFILTDRGRCWHLDLRNKPGSCGAGDPGGGGVEVDTSLSLTSDTLQVQYSTVQYSTVQYSTVQYSTPASA